MCKFKKVIIFAAGCIALLFIGYMYAYWSGNINHTNHLTADVTAAKIVEKFEQNSPPNGTVPKKVSFQNNSSNAAFLRVSYAETWEKADGEDTLLLNNKQNDSDVAAKEWTSAWKDRSLWHDGGDGWFYYKKILLPGNTTAPVLTGVTFPDYSGIYKEYECADYQLYFRMELLQASDSQSTLNSSEVNTKASETVFGKTAVVHGENVNWK